jgi:hypothetical protein
MGLDPVSIGIAAIATSAIGTGVSAYSQNQAAKASASLSSYNAALEQQQADVAQRDAAITANAQRANNARILAKQRAAFAANGVDASTGSPLLVEAQQAGYLEMGALETQRQGGIRAGQYQQQATLDTLQAAATRRAGSLNTAATILQGAGKVGSQYYGIS